MEYESTEARLIGELIEWLEDSDRQKVNWNSTLADGWAWVKQIEEFLDNIKLYHADLLRRDADEGAAYLKGRRAGAKSAWNEMRNFVQMRSSGASVETGGDLTERVGRYVLERSADKETAEGVINDITADMRRFVAEVFDRDDS